MNDEKNDELVIGILSDTHIPSRGPNIPQEIIKDFKEKDIDFLFHLGDFTQAKVYSDLIELFGKDKVIAIAGNMDDNELSKSLPSSRDLTLYGYKIFLTHGFGGPKGVIRRLNNHYDLSQYDIVVFGHIHKPVNKKKDKILYINPGSPTDKRFTDVNTYGILRLSEIKADFNLIYL
ncbi:MAG: YfcE family phosphodiesterase [Candidatus Lokiarchaeota archaeon]|nr:YfcE family phosphodiesterase [Candidatus Lokiarchaeota archaeon]MBD3200270.1 YfcE family phosphodiesterase [Candidatus Lokiarchaeota archaeon]